jgi:nucleoside-diphosphate-sugar epimerase
MIEELISAKNASTPSIVLHGHPDAPCPLVFAADAAKAVVTACSLPGCHEPIWLFPKGDAGTFGRLAVDLARLVGYTGKVSIDGAEEWTPSSDGIMAREILGWESKTPLEVGLAETVQWRLGLQPVQSTGGGAKA